MDTGAMAMLGGVLRSWRKRRAIRSYIRRLPRQLRRDYGWAERYTPAQIRASITRARLDRSFSCYAQALYTDAAAFAADHAARGESCDHGHMRAELQAEHFRGHAFMTSFDALLASEAGHSERAGDAIGHHAEGAGHHGSDGGHAGW